MFTGLIESLGRVEALDLRPGGADLTLSAPDLAPGLALGDSLAVEGVCLTVAAHLPEGRLRFGLAPETLRRSALGSLKPGDSVNLERAMLPTQRLGGHVVQGHVDTTGRLLSREPEGEALLLRIGCDPAWMPLIVEKGYVAVDGASLTVVATGPDWFSLTLVPYSQGKLSLTHRAIGAPVNLETDILGKYVAKLLRHALPSDAPDVSPALSAADPS